MLAHVCQCVKVCSLCVQMSQVNPGFFSALNLKSELESGQAADSSEAAQYLNRLIKRPVPEKPIELWKTYLRRCPTHALSALSIISFAPPTLGPQYPAVLKSIILRWLHCDSCFYLTPTLCFVILALCPLLSCHCHVLCLSLVSDVEIKHLARTNDIMCIVPKPRQYVTAALEQSVFMLFKPYIQKQGRSERRICLDNCSACVMLCNVMLPL